jgi:uncharacterized phage infection (PIP) family protein YhgE
MLSKMKQELQRVKNDNGELKKKLDTAMDDAESSKGTSADSSTTAGWETEREKLQKEVSDIQSQMQTSVTDLESKLTNLQSQLHSAQSELETAKSSHSTAQSDLSALQTSFTASRSDIERLQKENSQLEARAKDAENKVQLLLDQVESSVDNYRRQSRIAESGAPVLNGSSANAFRTRPASISEASDSASENPTPVKTSAPAGISHSRDTSNVTASSMAGSDTRNSLALDSLASELDALRSHWETTNKNYRLSDRFDFEGGNPSADSPTIGNAPSANPGTSSAASGGGLADWRRGLEIDDDDEQNTRPGTSEGLKVNAAGGRDVEDDLPTPKPDRTAHVAETAS